MKMLKPGMIIQVDKEYPPFMFYNPYAQIVAANDKKLLIKNPLPDLHIGEYVPETIDAKRAVHLPFIGPAFIDALIMLMGQDRVSLMGMDRYSSLVYVEAINHIGKVGFRVRNIADREALRAPYKMAGRIPPLVELNERENLGKSPFEILDNNIRKIGQRTALPLKMPSVPNENRTSTVIGLVNAIFHNHEFDRLPVLADALEESSFNNETVLNHCRSKPTNPFHGHWITWELLK